MKLAVKLFARARDLAESDTVEIDVSESATVADVRTALRERCPALAPLTSSLLVAVNTEYAQDDSVIGSSAEVACFPPVSGG